MTFFAKNQRIADSSVTFTQVVRTTTSGHATPATTNLRSIPFSGMALSSASTNGVVYIEEQGALNPTIFNLGDGYACAVGTTVAGFPVRATDVTCVSAPNWIGTCDAHGNITIAPVRKDNLDVVDFGADSTGVTLCDPAFAAVVAAAQDGQTIFFPAGVYRYVKTFQGFPSGVNIQGVAGGHRNVPTPYAGSILQYEGLADAVRFGTFQIAVSAVRDLLIRSNNPNNISSRRDHPVRTIGAVAGVANLGGLVQIHTVVPHELVTGMLVCIDSVTGTTEANGGWQCTVQDSTHFTLDGSAFVHTYDGYGRARTRCGAGIGVVLTSEFLWENVYCTGFGVGFMLDGAQNARIIKCNADGHAGNGAGGPINAYIPKRFSCAYWLTDGDSGANGLTISGATAVDTIEGANGSGTRCVFQIDGCVNININKCTQPNIDGTGMHITNVTNVVNSGGLIQVTTDAPHLLVTGDYVGIRGVVDQLGTNNVVNDEWRVTRVDNTNFTLIGANPAGFNFPYLRLGVVDSFSPCTFARIHRATVLSFDGCYTEGQGDGHYLIEKASEAGATNASQVIRINGHVAAGASPFLRIYQEAVSELTVSECWIVANQSEGAQNVVGTHVRLGNFLSIGSGALPFWNGDVQVVPERLLVVESDGINRPSLLTKDCSAGGTITLSSTEIAHLRYKLTGSPAADFTVIIGIGNGDSWTSTIWNATSKNVTIKGSGGDTGVIIPAGIIYNILSDGTNAARVQ